MPALSALVGTAHPTPMTDFAAARIAMLQHQLRRVAFAMGGCSRRWAECREKCLCLQALPRSVSRLCLADRLRADHQSADHRGDDDRSLAAHWRREGAGNRHRQRLSSGDPRRVGRRRLFDRASRRARPTGRIAITRPRLPQCFHQNGRRLAWLARRSTLRPDHCHRRRRGVPAAALGPAHRRRHPRWPFGPPPSKPSTKCTRSAADRSPKSSPAAASCH